MNYNALKIEILDIMLRDQDPSALSRRLGYSFNQVERWKSGRKQLRWNEFCDLCEVLNYPLYQTLHDVFCFPVGMDSDDNRNFPQHFHKLFLGSASLQEIGQRHGIHHSALRRVFNGEVSPDLELVLALVDKDSTLLSSFILKLLKLDDPKHSEPLPPLMSQLKVAIQRVSFETTHPYASAIEGLLCTREYQNLPQHDPEWFCRKLRISRYEFEACWKLQLQLKQVALGENEKYHPTFNSLSTSGASTQEMCNIVRHWTERARERFSSATESPPRKPGSSSMVAYRIVPMNEDTSRKATEILIKAYEEIVRLAESSPGPYQDVRILLLHHFSVDEIPDTAHQRPFVNTRRAGEDDSATLN